MNAPMIGGYLLYTLAAISFIACTEPSFAAVTETHKETGWKLYTNARFGFSVRYPDDWRLGNPLPDGIGVTLYPPIERSLVAVSGHMNVVSGNSQDGRQTLKEFADAHRRIITDLYGKKNIRLTWGQDQERLLGGLPGKQVTFTYHDDKHIEMIEHHIFSLGRNEGRGIRIKVPAAAQREWMPIINRLVETFEPGRDQNAVSPIVPK